MPDSTASPVLRGLADQGYYEHSTAELERLDRALRFTPAAMLVLAIVGLATRQPAIHGLLAAIGLVALALPAHHPLDLLYNHLVRRLAGGPELPPNPLPRRLAGLAAAGLNLGIGVAFATGRTGPGLGLGAVLVVFLAALVARQFCLVSWLLTRLAQWSNPPQEGHISGERARQLVEQGALLVDVRSAREFANGHLPGAINVPVDQVDRHTEELLARQRPLILYCAAGVRCAKAAGRLRQAGGEVHELGMMSRWPRD